MTKKKTIIILIAVGIIGFGYYAISPIFKNIEVQDEIPISIAGSENVEEKMGSKYAVVATTGHPAQGHVRVIDISGESIIRFEEFKTLNGPNLHVYLSKDKKASDFIDLGKIRGTEGNINYAVPDDVDVSEYRYVLTWCVPFGVLFNYADLKES